MSAFDMAAALAAGYFIGGIPFAAILVRLRGKNVFEVGSGNMGAMNTARNVGVAVGLAVFVLDVGKGAFAVTVGSFMASSVGASDPLGMALVAGVGAVLGHAWSPYVGFKGGKALAAIFGSTLPILPALGFIALGLLIALSLIWRKANERAQVVAVLALPFVAASLTTRMDLADDRSFAITTAAGASAVVALAKIAAVRRARLRSDQPN